MSSTPFNVQTNWAALAASACVRYEFFGVPSRLKWEDTLPRGRVDGSGRRRRFMQVRRYSDGVQLTLSPQGETELLVRSTPTLDDGDHERFTHIVLEGYTPKDGEFVALENSVVAGMVNSTPVKALCGKVWVPGRDPQKYPLCGTCKEIAASMGWSLPSA